MRSAFAAAFVLLTSLSASELAGAFEFEGFKSGMSLQDVLSMVGSEPMRSVAGPNGSVILLSKPYSFELCKDKLTGISKVFDRRSWLTDYKAYSDTLGDPDIQSIKGQTITTVYFRWHDRNDDVVLGLNIDTAQGDLGYAINLRGSLPCTLPE